MTTARSGGCLCGATRYEATVRPRIDACHCQMCRRWTGGLFLSVRADDLTWTADDAVTTYRSSTWAERGFCQRCGTALFYRLRSEAHGPNTFLMVGTLDDDSGLELGIEWFIDRKPSWYALEGERRTITEAEAMAMFEADAASSS